MGNEASKKKGGRSCLLPFLCVPQMLSISWWCSFFLLISSSRLLFPSFGNACFTFYTFKSFRI